MFVIFLCDFCYISFLFLGFTPLSREAFVCSYFCRFSTFSEQRSVRDDDPLIPGGFEEEWIKVEEEMRARGEKEIQPEE